MKRTLLILLVLIMCVSAFVSCANTTDGETVDAGGEETTVAPEETENMNYVPELPEMNCTGKELKLLINDGFWAADDVWIEEDSEDAVNSAIYQRNHTVMDTYGFDIIPTLSSSVNGDIKLADKSGSTDYDVAIFCCYEACPTAAEGIFLDLTTVPNLNLDKHYWDQNMYDGLSIDGKLFYITGDISTKAGAGTFLMIYNKKLATDYDLPNLYDLVREKKWTIDKLNEIVTEYGYRDDGDGQVGVEDTFGMGIQREAYLALYFGCGGRMVEKDADDLPQYTINTTKNLDILEKIYDLTATDNKTIDSHQWLNVTGDTQFASTMAFADNRSIFIITNASNIAGFREMESDFGVLPVPLYNEEQEDYCSYVYHGAAVYCIPRNCTDPEFVGFALEALCAESYKTVTPAYYEKTLYGQYQRDADSYEMLDIAFRNRLWDLGYYARFAGVDDSFIAQIQKGPDTFVSWYDKSKKSVNKQIAKYIDSYEKATGAE